MRFIWKIIRKKIKRKRKKNSIRSKKEYLKYKEKARLIIYEKLKYWQYFYKNNFHINLDYKKVFIKNVKTRWGSCSSKQNLNFSYKIFFLDTELQDYLIVHELCHLKEMNHGKNFWDLVSLSIADVKNKRLKLKSVQKKF